MKQKFKNLFGNSFGKDVLITILGQVGVLLFTFLINKLVSIYLGPTVYTQYRTIVLSASVIAFISVLGLGIALPRFIPRYQAKNDQKGVSRTYIASIILMMGTTILIFAIVLINKNVFSKLIYGDINKAHYILPILLFACYLVFTTLLYAYYRALNRFYSFNFSQLLVQGIMLAIVLISRSNLMLLVYLIGIIISILALIFCLIYSAKHAKTADIKSFKTDIKPHLSELTKFCLPRVPGELFLFAFTAIPIIILTQRIGETLTTGFNVSITINTTITSLFSFVGMVLLPYVSKSVTTGDFKDAQEKVKKLGQLYIILSILAIIGVMLLTNLVIRILFSSQYLVYAPEVRIMVLSILPNAIYLLLRNPIDAVSKFPFNTINLGISFSILLILIFKSDTINDYAISFVIAYTILGVLSTLAWIYCKRKAPKVRGVENV